MKHVHYDEVESKDASEAGATATRVRWLINKEDGAPTFCMRRFELEAGGRTPRHGHEWEHEVYILEGTGTLHFEGEERAFRPGDVIFLAPHENHCFLANRDEQVVFLCLIPNPED